MLRTSLPRWLLPAAGSGLCSWSALRFGEEPPERKDAFSASAEVSSILVPVTVRDGKGRLVSTLEQGRFHLFVDDMEFPIKSFWREGGLPISYTFVVDTSGSMNGRRLAKTREAIMEFVRQLRPDDEVCLITFGAGEVKRRLSFGTDPGLRGAHPRVSARLRHDRALRHADGHPAGDGWGAQHPAGRRCSSPTAWTPPRSSPRPTP